MKSLVLCNPRDLECFKALFEVESYIRLIVLWELKGNYGLSWKGIIPGELVIEAQKRQRQELDLGCVDANRSNILSYLNLSELKDILVKTDLWDSCFKNYWGAQDIVLADFKRLIAVRNKVAHFRSVTVRDFRLVKSFLEHLNYRTSNYDTIRSLTNRINLDNMSNPPSNLCKSEFVTDIIAIIHPLNGFNEHHVSLFSLANHWGVEIHVNAGSVQGDEFMKYVDKNQRFLSVCRMGVLGEKIEIQFSKKIPFDKSQIMVIEALELCKKVTNGISSEDAMELYRINLREEILPWSLNFPCSCKIDQYI